MSHSISQPGDYDPGNLDLLGEEIHLSIHELQKYRLGRVLTIVDASIADPEQRKAFKDLVNQVFWDREFFSEHIKQRVWDFAKVHAPDLCKDEDQFVRRMSGTLAA